MRVFTVFDGVSVSLCVGAGQGRAGQGREGRGGGGLEEEAKSPKLASNRRKDGLLCYLPRSSLPVRWLTPSSICITFHIIISLTQQFSSSFI